MRLNFHIHIGGLLVKRVTLSRQASMNIKNPLDAEVSFEYGCFDELMVNFQKREQKNLRYFTKESLPNLRRALVATANSIPESKDDIEHAFHIVKLAQSNDEIIYWIDNRM